MVRQSMIKKVQVISLLKVSSQRRIHDGGGETNPWIWGKNLFFGKILAENCMKMKELGPRGQNGPSALAPGSTNVSI